MSTPDLFDNTLNSFNLGNHLISSLMVICGKVKSGKTTLITNILNSIKSNTFEEVLYFNKYSSSSDIITQIDSLFKAVLLEDDDTFAPVKRRIVIIDGIYSKIILESLQLKRLYAKHKYMGITFIHSINHINMLESFMLEQIDYFFLFKEIYTCYQQTIFTTIVQQCGYVLDVNMEEFLYRLHSYTIKPHQCLVINQTLYTSKLNSILNYYYTQPLSQTFEIGDILVDGKQNTIYNNPSQNFNSFYCSKLLSPKEEDKNTNTNTNYNNILTNISNNNSNNNSKDLKQPYLVTKNIKKYNVSSRSKTFTKNLHAPNNINQNKQNEV